MNNVLIKVITFYLLLVISLSKSIASEDFKTCSKSGLTILYVNGVMTTYDSAKLTKNKLKSVVENNYKSEKVDIRETVFDFSYNPSLARVTGVTDDLVGKVALGIDAAECLRQKIAEETSETLSYYYTEMYLKFGGAYLDQFLGKDISSTIRAFEKKITFETYVRDPESQAAYADLDLRTRTAFSQNKKVIHVAHSQGGFNVGQLASEIVAGISGYESYKNLYGAIFLGTPIKYLPRSLESEKFSYLSAEQDIIVDSLYSRNLALQPNLNMLYFIGTSIEGHSIDNTYLGNRVGIYAGKAKPIRDHFYDLLRNSISTLDNNDEACCNKRDGKLWINSGNCTGLACQGGFIEKAISYNPKDTGIEIHKDAKICQDQSNKVGRPVVSGNVSLKGDILLGDSAKILGSTSRYSSPITIDTQGEFFRLKGTTAIEATNGSPQFKGLFDIDGNTTISGKGKYEGIPVTATGGGSLGGRIKDSQLSGENNFSGSYTISDSTVKETKITGTPYILPSPDFPVRLTGTFDKSTIMGSAFIEGNVSEALIDGKFNGPSYTLGSYAIFLNGDVIGPGTEVKGRVSGYHAKISNGAKLNGNRGTGIQLAANNDSYSITISGGNVRGAGVMQHQTNISASDFDGCFWQTSFANFSGKVVSGTVYIVGDTPTNPNQSWSGDDCSFPPAQFSKPLNEWIANRSSKFEM